MARPNSNPKIKNLGAGIKDVANSVKPAVNATLNLIDKAKVLGDIGNSTVDGELESELKDLLRRKAELEFERAQAKLGVKQAELQLATIELKAQQSQADLAAAQQMLDTLTADNKLLGRVTSMLMRRAQDYMSHLLQFQFWATRALDIYALKNYTGSLRFDIGYVHPDVEGCLRYIQPWRRKPCTESDGCVSHFVVPVSRDHRSSKRVRIVSHESAHASTVLELQQQSSRTSGTPAERERRIRTRAWRYISGPVRMQDRRSHRSACRRYLNGALINCVLMHRGESSSVRLDGSVTHLHYPPRGCPLPAVKTTAQIDSAPSSSPEAFWGRSPVAKWRLYVEPDALSKADLTGLTEVLVSLSYKAFIPSLQGVQAEQETAMAR